MKSDYDYYLMGCKDRGVRPTSAWRFGKAYAKYKAVRASLAVDAPPARTFMERQRQVARWARLRDFASLVRRGQDIFALAKRYGEDENGDGHAGAGAREPRLPVSPVLSGVAASPMPNSDDADLTFWRV